MLSVGLALALGIYAIPGITQQAPPQQAALPYQVAVVDLAQIIRAHPDFRSKREALEQEFERIMQGMQAEHTAIEQARRALDATGPRAGTLEHQQAFEQLASRAAQFEASLRAQQRRFALRESQLMYDTHKDIKEMIGRVATAGNIAQVTDFRYFEVDPTIPETVAEDMDQRLVWYNPRLNITNSVIQNIYHARNIQIPEAIQAAMREGRPIR